MGRRMTWFAWSLLTIAIWGFWGFLAKMALRQMRWHEMLLVASATYMILYLVFIGVLFYSFRPALTAISAQAASLATAAAAAGFAGVIPFYLALNEGNAAIVVPLTAIYPVITVLLSVVFLGETLTISQALAVMMFVAGTILVSR